MGASAQKWRLCLGLAGILISAQAQEFEVATVKPNRSGQNGDRRPDLQNGVLTARNVTLHMMLRAAYELHESRIIGPDWLDSDRFDLAGKAPAGVPDTEFMPMLQALLKERFQLAVHRETKEMPVFDMVVAKGGLKIWQFDPARPVVKRQGRGHRHRCPPRNLRSSLRRSRSRLCSRSLSP